MWVQALGCEDSLEEEMATHSILAWRILWAEEAGGLIGLQRVGHDRKQISTIIKKKITHTWSRWWLRQ